MSPSIVLPEAGRRQLLTIYRKWPPHLRLSVVSVTQQFNTTTPKGRRAFLRALRASPCGGQGDNWVEMQKDRYRYSAEDGSVIRIVLAEHLACTVRWARVTGFTSGWNGRCYIHLPAQTGHILHGVQAIAVP